MEASFIAVRDQVVADRFGEETFLVNFRNGRYYAMRGAGGLIWRELERPQSAASILGRLERACGGTLPETAPSDIVLFLGLLKTQGLVVESAETAGGAPALAESGEPGAYQSPVLEVFDDLSELISVDPVHEVDNERGWPVQPK
jgi:hypothetical protein